MRGRKGGEEALTGLTISQGKEVFTTNGESKGNIIIWGRKKRERGWGEYATLSSIDREGSGGRESKLAG